MSGWVFPVGVLGAAALGLGYVLQQRVAATAPLSDTLRFRLLLDLMRRRVWWFGIAAMVVGELLAGLALQLASVGLVEPLLSTNLLFALLFANLLARHRICWQEVCGAALLSASLGVFIAVGDPDNVANPTPDSVNLVLAVASVAVVVGGLVVVARRRGAPAEAVLLSIGAGLLLGLQDVATRAVLVVADRHGIPAVLADPWIYVVVSSAVIGLLLSQSAFKLARLDWSLPPIAAAEPLAGVLLGVTVLGDTVSVSIPGLAAESACLVGMVLGVALIGRSPGLAGHHLMRQPARPEVGLSPARAARADPL